ncbi:FecR family protein [Sinomicrobium sp. M5D2P17]
MTPEIEKIYIKVILNHPLNFREEQLLKERIEKDPELEPFLRHLRDIRNAAYSFEESDLDEKKALQALKKRMKFPRKRIVPLRSWLKYAAVFLGIVATGYGIYTSRSNRETGLPKITLQLGDGTVRELDEKKVLIITGTDGRQVVSQEKNTLRYDREHTPVTDSVRNNLLTVPYAKTFQLTLSDGTHIYLNSGTRIKYPETFRDRKNRVVEIIDGEAYFSVTRDTAHPFIVQTNDMDIKVLGTEFNISAYREDRLTRAVLVEGSVRATSGMQEKTLVPEEIASYDKEEKMLFVNPVEVESHIAWTKGKMRFINEPFESIVKKIERSYGVKIINQNMRLQGAHFYGDFDINEETVDDVLKIFSTGKPFSYERVNNTILIKPDSDKTKNN